MSAIEFLAVLAVFSIIAAVYMLISGILACCAYFVIETLINRNAPSCRQFWIMVLFPITIPMVIGYELYKRYQRSVRSASCFVKTRR